MFFNHSGKYDTSHIRGGSPFTKYSSALALAGSSKVLSISLMVDGEWFFLDGQQTVSVDNVVINNKSFGFERQQ